MNGLVTSGFNALWQMNTGLFFLVMIWKNTLPTNASPSPFNSAPYEALSPITENICGGIVSRKRKLHRFISDCSF